MPGKRKATDNNRNTGNKRLATSVDASNRTLVCAVRGLEGRVCTSADAFIRELLELIHRQNADQLTGIDPETLDAYSTNEPRLGWARVSANGGMISRGNPLSKSFLHPSKRVRDYFPANIPPSDSGVVHVVVDVIVQPSVGSQVNEIGTVPLADDKPAAVENLDDEIQRYRRVEKALGLFVHWSIRGTDFSKQHDYQDAKWLEYGCGWWDDQRPSRVYIGDKTTWRELYVASNEVVQREEGREGSRWVESFTRVSDGPTLEVFIGT